MGIVGKWVRASGPWGLFHFIVEGPDRAGRVHTACNRHMRPHPKAPGVLRLPSRQERSFRGSWRQMWGWSQLPCSLCAYRAGAEPYWYKGWVREHANAR